MSELVEFIRGCLDADEEFARAAIERGALYPWGNENLPPMRPDEVPDAVRGHLGGTWGEHFARHDPARVLAEVNAKRAILERITDVAWATYAVRDTLLLEMAQPYAGEPGWRDEWGTSTQEART